MNTNEYLHELEKSPDINLDNLGVRENYPINLRADPEEIKALLKDQLEYGYLGKAQSLRDICDRYLAPISVVIQIFNHPFSPVYYFDDIIKKGKYNCALTLHAKHEEEISKPNGISEERAIAKTIIEISRKLIIPKKIPACFVQVTSPKQSKDLSKIVYHP